MTVNSGPKTHVKIHPETAFNVVLEFPGFTAHLAHPEAYRTRGWLDKPVVAAGRVIPMVGLPGKGCRASHQLTLVRPTRSQAMIPSLLVVCQYIMV